MDLVVDVLLKLVSLDCEAQAAEGLEVVREDAERVLLSEGLLRLDEFVAQGLQLPVILLEPLLLALLHHSFKGQDRILKLSLSQNSFRLWDHGANRRDVAHFADEADFESLETISCSLGELDLFFFLKIKRLLGYLVQTFRRVYFGVLEVVQVDGVETAAGQHVDVVQTHG